MLLGSRRHKEEKKHDGITIITAAVINGYLVSSRPSRTNKVWSLLTVNLDRPKWSYPGVYNDQKTTAQQKGISNLLFNASQ